MKRLLLLPAMAILLLQCSKDKNEKAKIDLRKGLLANFKMNGDFTDSTGNVEIVASSAQGIAPATDRNGNPASAMAFDGGKMSASIPGSGWSANPITVSLWVKPADPDGANYMLTSNEAVIGIAQQSLSMGFVISHPITRSAMAEIDNGWTHITGTYDGTDIRCYINGEHAASFVHPGQPKKITFIELAYMNNVPWIGTLDELRFYDRLLSEEEIAQLANY